MTKLEYLKYAIELKLYTRKDWFISCFAITDSSKVRIEGGYLGRVITTPWGYSYIGENQEIFKIDDSIPNEPLFKFKDKLTIDNTWISNTGESIETTIGNLLVNYILLISCFSNKIPYLTGKISIEQLEVIIAKKLLSNPKPNENRLPDYFYVDEYIKFVDAAQFLSSLSQLTTTAVTRRTLLPPTGLEEFKKTLLEKYKGKLHDSVELSKFEKELSDFDNKYLEGDESNGKFLSGKVKNVARKKLYLTMGSEGGFDDNNVADPITNSLYEKLPIEDPKQFVTLMNGLRSGSYSRGSETVKGGVSAKVLLRATNNFTISEVDCKTTLGLKRLFTKSNIYKLVGRYIIEKDNLVHVENIDIANNYIDKNIVVRSPMYCKTEGQQICFICSGSNLAKYKNGLSIPVTEISSIILSTSLKKMHSSVLSVSKVNLANIIS
jgi:hypothetical protein